MKICQVHPACGLEVPPRDWGAIEKIIWEFHQNFLQLGIESEIQYATHIYPGQYDIVICHVANLTEFLRERKIPYIFQLHDHHVYHNGKDSHAYKENLKAIENSLISLIPSKFLVDYMGSSKGQYFSHGVNTKEFYPIIGKSKPSTPKLLMLANNGLAGNSAYDRKGFAYGLGLAMLNNLEITIAGPSNNKHFFSENPWSLNYSKLNLVFDTPNTELLDLYHQHDVFIHPTMLEAGHPNLTMIEAAAAGLPIIANWEHSVNFHGAWRAPRNVFEMDRGLTEIMDNWETFRKSGIETGMRLSWKNRSKELLDIIKSL